MRNNGSEVGCPREGRIVKEKGGREKRSDGKRDESSTRSDSGLVKQQKYVFKCTNYLELHIGPKKLNI